MEHDDKKDYIAFAFDRNYIAPTKSAVYSLLSNNSLGSVRLALIGDGLSVSDIRSEFSSLLRQFGMVDEAVIVSVDVNDYVEFCISTVSHITNATSLRLLLPSLLHDANRILYLDSDVIVLQSIVELFAIDLRGCVVAMGLDFLPESETRYSLYRYHNAGVLLIDAERWNSYGVSERAAEFFAREKPRWMDQDALNVLLDGRIYTLSPAYNYLMNGYANQSLPPKHQLENIRILHFNGSLKPWQSFCSPLLRQIYNDKGYTDT